MNTGGWPRAWWKTSLRRLWPWLVLVLAVIPAVWHVVDFEEDVDPEFPQVVRPTFSFSAATVLMPPHWRSIAMTRGTSRSVSFGDAPPLWLSAGFG